MKKLSMILILINSLFASSPLILTHQTSNNEPRKPDLAIVDVKINKNIYEDNIIGKNREIVLVIKNIGKARSNRANLKVFCKSKNGCPKILIGKTSILSLNPGQKREISWPIKYDKKFKWSAGKYHFFAKIESAQNYNYTTAQTTNPESNLKNNKKSFLVVVKKRKKCDLAVADIRLSKKICAGDEIRKSGKILTTIKNIGKSDSFATTLKVSCKKRGGTGVTTFVAAVSSSQSCPLYLKGTTKIPSLKPGRSFILKWPPNSSKKWHVGDYDFEFFVDDKNRVEEENEKNNIKKFTLNVKNCQKKISLSPGAIKPIGKIPFLKEPIFKKLNPIYWYKGKIYQVYILGSGFKKDINFKFDKNIKIVSKKVINSKKIALKIKLNKELKKGKARLLYGYQGKKFIYTGLYGWIREFKKLKKLVIPKIKLPKFSIKTPFIKGKIILETPKFGEISAGGKRYDYGIPKLNDKTVFRFREENPGLADWFELKIIDKNGKELLTRNLGKNLFYRADPTFVYEILSIMKSKGIYIPKSSILKPGFARIGKDFLTKKEQGTKTKQLYKKSFVNLSPKKLRQNYKQKHSKNIALYWMIVGKKRYPKDGIIKIGEIEIKSFEVAIVEESEKWPLAINDFATGLGCRATSRGSVNLQNIDMEIEGEPGKVSAVNYVGDRFELSGVFDISNSPWGYSKPNPFFTAGGLINLDPMPRNIFISWGDGSVEPLRISAISSGSKFKINNMIHKYMSTGIKKVKIFMLPESDIQNIDVKNVVYAYDFYEGTKSASLNPVTSTNSFDAPYYQILSLSGDMPKPNMNLLDIAKHAYIIYCNEITIEPRKDLVATGPLHLDDITIFDYNGGKSNKKSRDKTLGIENRVKTANINADKLKSETKYNLTNIKKKKSSKLYTTKTTKKALSPIKSPYLEKDSFKIESVKLSQCDILQANAKLRYFGEGDVLFKWTLIGPNGEEMVLGTQLEHVGPSVFRKNLTKETYKTPTQDSYSNYFVNSNILYLDQFLSNKMYSINVDAIVDLKTAFALSQEEVVNYINFAIAQLNFSTKFASNRITNSIYLAKKERALNPYLRKIKSSGVKLGILSPSKRATKGLPIVASINKALDKSMITRGISKIKIPKRKPYYVKSDPFLFTVTQNNSGKPCKIRLVTKSNDIFWIRNISDSVTITSDNIYNGTGNIVVKINSSEPKEIVVPVNINGWRVGGEDGITVQDGILDTELESRFVTDSVEFVLRKIFCKALESDLELTADLFLQESLIREVGSSEKVSWTGLKSRLDDKGNWHFVDSGEKEFSIGWSGFRLKTSEIYIDFDKNWGKGALGECSVGSGNQKEWTGVHFTDATIIPNTFSLVQSGYTKKVTDWGVSNRGLCGKVKFGSFNANIKKGSISFDSIEAEAKEGNFNAIYKNMDVYVPWLQTHLKGDAKLVDNANIEEPSIDFKGLHSDGVEKDYGLIKLKAQDLVFGSYKDVGWGVWSNTSFTLSTETKEVVKDAVVNGLIYGFDEKAYLKEDVQTVSISGKANFGGTEVDLISMEVSASKEKNTLLDFVLNTNFNVSEVLSAVPVTVRYSLDRLSGSIVADGPNVDPFIVPVAFPVANPNMESRITCNYEKESGKGAKGAPDQYDQFNGSVDFELFEGQTIKASFRLGYINGRDYWMIKAAMPFEDGVVLMDPGLMLYEIRGGLGHNFPLDSFKKAGSINDIYPSMDNTFMFFAGVDVGNENKFLYYAKGDLVIRINQQARIDARAWLLDYKRKGNGDFQAFLQFANGSFDGALWGKLDFLKGLIVAEIPKNAAVLHIALNDWYFYFGRKNGPRVRMKLLISEADSYLELEKGRYAIGGRIFYGLKGKYGKLYGEVESGYEIRFPPHVSGYGEGTLAAQICCCKKCIGPSLSARVEGSAMPLKIKTRACFELWPFGKICCTFKL